LTNHTQNGIEIDAALRDAEGTAFFSGTVWKGRRAMRISVVNWRTSDSDVHATIDAVARVLVSMGSEM